MAILAALFAFGSRFVGKILTTAMGWVVVSGSALTLASNGGGGATESPQRSG